MVQCQRLIDTDSTNRQIDPKTERLSADLFELQQLLEKYLHAVSQIPGLANDYSMLQRRIRIRARKIQPVKTDNVKRK